jgi:peptidoglycan hydrolase CwlO-like protein
MEKELCTERHKRIDEKLDTLNKRVNNHSERLDRIEQAQSEFRIEIKNLCEDLKSLTSVLKWFIGLLVGSFVAFFFYAVQNNIFK